MMRNQPYRYSVQKIPEIKLLVLYIAEQARSVCKQTLLSRLWLSDFVMENISTDYFMFQCCVGELVAEDYLKSNEDGDGQDLSITAKGTETVGYFFTELPLSVRETVDKGLTASLSEKKKKDAVYAEALHLNDRVHIASLRLYDGETPQMRLEVTLPDKELATALSRAMRKNPEFLYHKMMDACNEILETDTEEAQP